MFTCELPAGQYDKLEVVACSSGRATIRQAEIPGEPRQHTLTIELGPQGDGVVTLIKKTSRLEFGESDTFSLIQTSFCETHELEEWHPTHESHGWRLVTGTGQLQDNEERVIPPGQWGYFQALTEAMKYDDYIDWVLMKVGLDNISCDDESRQKLIKTALKALPLIDERLELQMRLDTTIPLLQELMTWDPEQALAGLVCSNGMWRTAGVQIVGKLRPALAALAPDLDLDSDGFVQIKPPNS